MSVHEYQDETAFLQSQILRLQGELSDALERAQQNEKRLIELMVEDRKEATHRATARVSPAEPVFVNPPQERPKYQTFEVDNDAESLGDLIEKDQAKDKPLDWNQPVPVNPTLVKR